MRDRRWDGTSHRGASCVPPGLWPAQRRSTVQAPSCSASALAAGSPALHRQSRPLGLCFPGTQAEMPPPHAAAPEFSRDCRKVHQEPGQARHVIQAHSSPGAPASALTPAISGSAAHDPHFFPPSPDVPRFLFPQGLCLFRASASSGLLRPRLESQLHVLRSRGQLSAGPHAPSFLPRLTSPGPSLLLG